MVQSLFNKVKQLYLIETPTQVFLRTPILKNICGHRLELFLEIVVLENFGKIHRKTPVPESLFQ